MSTNSPKRSRLYRPTLPTMVARVMLAVTAGVTLFAASLWGQNPTAPQTAAPAATRSDDIQLPYRLRLIGRDSSGAYVTSGVIKGETQGRATVRLRFENGSSGQPGAALVHTHWAVLAEPASDSFEAELHGTLQPVSGQMLLVGAITSGARRGQRVETESRLLDFGPNGAVSDVDGTMTIGRPAPLHR
jgi:hypothetical protein